MFHVKHKGDVMKLNLSRPLILVSVEILYG